MLIIDRSVQVTLGILLIMLLGPMAAGETVSRERLQMAQANAASPEKRASPEPGSDAATNRAGYSAVTNLSDNGSVQKKFGDGRTGFWIVGSLINLSVLGWFLVWALKEWRKKRDD